MSRFNKPVFQKQLLAWYRKHHRPLPWREISDPYAIWISEIMLQQTQVKTVLPYYERFLKRFPTVEVLASASLDHVLKSWEGLGYYSRARNLHRAAQMVVERFAGDFPSTVEELLALPGIGRYTAGAIASIAFHKMAPILDGNIERVLCRFFAIRKSPKLPAVREQLWQLSASLLPKRAVSHFNQALMELGALVCLPELPLCERCPVARHCIAYKQHLVEQLPLRPVKQALPVRKKVAFLISHREKLLLTKRPPHGLLGGLWEFPMMELLNNRKEIPLSRGAYQDWLKKQVVPKWVRQMTLHRIDPPVSHQFTHFKEIVVPLHLSFSSRSRPAIKKFRSPLAYLAYRWVGREEFSQLALTKTAHKILSQID